MSRVNNARYIQGSKIHITLDYIHADVLWPTNMMSRGGAHYFWPLLMIILKNFGFISWCTSWMCSPDSKYCAKVEEEDQGCVD